MGDEESGRELLQAAARPRARDVDAGDDARRRPRPPARRPRGPHARDRRRRDARTACPTRPSRPSSTVVGPGSGSPFISVELRQLGGALGSLGSGRRRGLAPRGGVPALLRRPPVHARDGRGTRVAPRRRRRRRSAPGWPASTTSTSPSARSTARRFYAGTTHDRLREIRERFDPTELFRANNRIQPAGSDW